MSIRWAAAPAKVNLTLSVGDRRPDGYHDISSVIVSLGLADRVTARPAAGSSSRSGMDRLVVTG
ncbi:MAG TPA: hypothetical protein VMH24_08485, partial [Candidatus Sulfotelmatobacter sp.]|nr:hypothetical protein [Candidatus Sulfotelmatobacter sp.]